MSDNPQTPCRAEKAKKQRKHWRLTARLLALLLFLSSGAVIFSARGTFGAASDTVEIKMGYAGFPFMTKAKYTTSELYGMGTETYYYSGMDAGGWLRYGAAEGITLETLLGTTDIDLGKIDHFNFRNSMDSHFANKDYSVSTLLWQERYFYPTAGHYYIQVNPAGYFEDPEYRLTEAEIINAISYEGQPVPTMLAVQASYIRWPDQTDIDYANIAGTMSDNGCIRLFVGQSSPKDGVAGDTIQGVNQILATLAGYPELSAGDDLEIKIGQDKQLELSISTADDEYSDFLLHSEEMTFNFSSSDPSVVQVDANGKLTAKSEGEVVITVARDTPNATLNPLSTSVRIIVGPNENNEGGGDGTGTGTGDGDGDGSGGSGAGGSTESGDGNNETGGETGNNTGSGNQSANNGAAGDGNTKPKPATSAQSGEQSPEANEQDSPKNEESSKPGEKPQTTLINSSTTGGGRPNGAASGGSGGNTVPFGTASGVGGVGSPQATGNTGTQTGAANASADESSRVESGTGISTTPVYSRRDDAASAGQQDADTTAEALEEEVIQNESVGTASNGAQVRVRRLHSVDGQTGEDAANAAGEMGGAEGGSTPMAMVIQKDFRLLILWLLLGVFIAGCTEMYIHYRTEFEPNMG